MPGQLGGRLEIPKHHGGSGGDTQSMGGGYYLRPLVHGDAARRDLVAQFLVQHFRGGSGEAAHSRGFKVGQVFLNGALRPYGTVKDFLR